jgi:predicted TIM-barrel fold metal-dependent hydrolase
VSAGTTRRVFDGHLHIIDPRFPLVPNRGYLPEPFTVEDYLDGTSKLDLVGGAVVSGSFQGFDQSYLLDALERLGPSFVGVTQLPASVTDEEVLRLHAAGVRAVRFNLYRSGSEALDDLESLAFRVHDLARWHAELYVDSKDLPELEERLTALPRVTIDHLGMTRDGYSALLRLVEKGVKVKATGFGRVRLDVPTALREISVVDPGTLIFGTDLPGTRAERPFEEADVDLIVETLGNTLAERILYENAAGWYMRDGKEPG